MANQSSFKPKRASTPNGRRTLNIQNDLSTGSEKDIVNQNSRTPNRLANLKSRIKLNLLSDSDTVSGKDMANQILFHPKHHQLQVVE